MILSMDEELIEGIRQGNEKLILSFIETYQDQVFGQAFKMIKNKHEAEEICQDVFIKIFRKIEGFKKDSKLSTWIYRITFTTCQDAIKKKKRRPKLVDIDDAASSSWVILHNALDQMETDEQRIIIDKAIEKLEYKDAILIDLYHLRELQISEISKIMDMTKSSIKVRLLRARKKLKVFLENLLPPETLEMFDK